MRPKPATLEQIRRDHFPEIAADCGNEEAPGIDEVEEWRDWYERDTTSDQNRIEDYLGRIGIDGLTILHVGVGNSSLARKFSDKASRIIGTTISGNEKRLADSLRLPQYLVYVHNKYSSQTFMDLNSEVDIIVDNNPTSFCCCWRHFCIMMDDYVAKLGRDGVIVSDKVGLGWVVSTPGANQRWRFSYEDWARVAQAFGLEASCADAFIYLLGRRPGLVDRARRTIARRLFPARTGS